MGILLDNMATMLFGITREEAHRMKVCINCKADIDKIEHDEDEYRLSGLCDQCYDTMFSVFI